MTARVTAVLLLLLPTVVFAQPKRLRFLVQPPGIEYVRIETTDTAQTIIDAEPAGTAFLFATGYHRHQSINPRTGDSFTGESGAILTGSKILASGSFVTSGSFWKITGQTQAMGTRAGECQITLADGYMGSISWATSYPGCTYREELFFNGVRKVHVQTLGEVGAGKWFFDYTTDEITVGDDPAGQLVETSVTTTAFNPTGNNVTITDLIIEQYASAAQYGAVNCEGATGWSLTNVTLRLNHSGGIRICTDLYMSGGSVTYNGQEGIVGIGDGVTIDGVEIAYNNGAHFDPGWEAGGTKFVLTNNLIVRNCNIHHNEGPGLWLDIDNYLYTLHNNNVHDNDQIGIFLEIGWAGDVYSNTVTNNGLAYWVPDYTWGAGILNAATKDLEVYSNTLSGNRGGIIGVQQSRGSGTFGTHLIVNYYVHDNTITVDKTGITPAWAGGIADDTSSSTIFTSDNNVWEDNDYTLKTDLNDYFVWQNAERNWTQWNGYGHDTPGGSAVTF